MPQLLSRFFVFLSVFFILSGCGEDPAPAAEPPVRPVKIFTVASEDASAIRNFPGVVEASQRAELGFRVSGTLQKILIKEGDRVAEGQLLAQLDPSDFQITVSDRKATAENAARNFERAKELIVDGNISRIDFDRMEANMKTSAAALKQAEQDLAYTYLKAPFAGRVAVTYVQDFEEITAKQEILRLQNEKELEVKVAVPESLVRSMRSGGDGQTRDKVAAFAEFEGRAGKRFPLTIKELSSKADPQTQTFQVTLAMTAPSDFPVLPGMTASVSIDFSRLINTSVVHWVPVRAVVAESKLEALVWVLNPDVMTVSSRKVEIGRMSGASIEITSGLSGGEEIISVGASYLAEGMKVGRMIQNEQAEPRADDPV